MTPPERRVCLMIERALPGARIHAQVSMGAIMNPAKGLSKSEWWTTFNKFSSKRVDFVAEDPETGQIILLVELDADADARWGAPGRGWTNVGPSPSDVRVSGHRDDDVRRLGSPPI